MANKIVEYHNYDFVSGIQEQNTTNNIDQQAKRIEDTLKSEPERIFEFLAKPIGEVHDDTVRAVNLMIDHLIDENGEDEGFDAIFGTNKAFSSGSLGNSLENDFINKRI